MKESERVFLHDVIISGKIFFLFFGENIIFYAVLFLWVAIIIGEECLHAVSAFE